MRTKFISTLTQLAETDDRICLLVGDLGYSVVENFKAKFPNRFFNMGVAEQNMMGVAAGLALSGKIVFTYSFGNFTTFRCLEQIRNDICYHNLDVKIIGIGTGFSYGTLGMTHHGTEDLAVMSVLPNMTIITPCDPVEMDLAIKASVAWKGPCYIRVRRTGEPVIHQTVPDFKIGKGIVVKDGDDVTLIATGWIINNVIKAAKMLESENIKARIISMHTVKPLDETLILESARKTRGIITVEDQNVAGLGSVVGMTLAASRQNTVPFIAMGLSKNYSYDVGSEEYHLEKSNLSLEAICHSAKQILTEY